MERLHMRVIRLLCVSSCLVWGLGACGGKVDTENEDNLGVAKQELWDGWGTDGVMGVQTTIVGISRAGNGMTPYAWDTSGWVCRGNGGLPLSGDLCGNAKYPYSAAGPFNTIVAVGIANDTFHVYAWYSDSTVSQGTSDNLTAYNGKITFTRPSKPGGGLFSMSDLIEADVTTSNQNYYYWKSCPTGSVFGSANDQCVVYRTTGTSNNGGAQSSATPVTYFKGLGDIIGISFGGYRIPTGARDIETWYASGSRNVSQTSLNLAQ